MDAPSNDQYLRENFFKSGGQFIKPSSHFFFKPKKNWAYKNDKGAAVIFSGFYSGTS